MTDQPHFVIVFKGGGSVTVPGTARRIKTPAIDGPHSRWEFKTPPGVELIGLEQREIATVVQYDPALAFMDA